MITYVALLGRLLAVLPRNLVRLVRRNGISVVDMMLTPGGPAITVSGTTMSLGPNIFVIGTSSIPLVTDDLTQVVTTIAGQTITANQTAVKVGNSTLTHGSPGLTVSGTIISLDSVGQLVVGSKTIPLDRASGSLDSEEFTTTVAGQGLTANLTAVLSCGLNTETRRPRYDVERYHGIFRFVRQTNLRLNNHCTPVLSRRLRWAHCGRIYIRKAVCVGIRWFCEHCHPRNRYWQRCASFPRGCRVYEESFRGGPLFLAAVCMSNTLASVVI